MPFPPLVSLTLWDRDIKGGDDLICSSHIQLSEAEAHFGNHSMPVKDSPELSVAFHYNPSHAMFFDPGSTVHDDKHARLPPQT